MQLNDFKPATFADLDFNKLAGYEDIDGQPFVIYQVLHKTFKGIAEPGDDKSEWQFVLAHADFHIHVEELKFYRCRASIYISGSSSDHHSLLQEFVNLVQRHSSQYSGRRLKKKIDNSTVVQIINPYAHSIQNAQLLHRGLASYFASPSLESEEILLTQFIGQYQVERAALQSAFIRYFSASEGFINLIYDLYCEPALKNDPEEYSKLLTKNLNVKIPNMAKYCTCFDNEAAFDHHIFKDYSAITDLRNDYIHANITPSMKNAWVNEDGFRFLLISDKSMKNRDLPRVFTDLEIKHIDFVDNTIQEMVTVIVNLMKPSYREVFERVYTYLEFLVEVKTNRDGDQYYEIIVPPDDW